MILLALLVVGHNTDCMTLDLHVVHLFLALVSFILVEECEISISLQLVGLIEDYLCGFHLVPLGCKDLIKIKVIEALLRQVSHV